MRAEDWENACHELLWEKGDQDLFLAIQRRAIDLFAERVKPMEPDERKEGAHGQLG